MRRDVRNFSIVDATLRSNNEQINNRIDIVTIRKVNSSLIIHDFSSELDNYSENE